MIRSCKYVLLFLAGILSAAGISAQAPHVTMVEPASRTAEMSRVPDSASYCHPSVGTSVVASDKSLRLTLIDKKQNYGGPADTKDQAVHSPKSINIHPAGKKYYVNSLEGCQTVVYDFHTNERLAVINHVFDSSTDHLWAPSSGLWPVTHYTSRKNPNTFSGKPVESTFSHDGRYLWVPYYRRSFDINAQDPSAVAVIDTENDEIIRMFETGPLPKMIATSPDGTLLAISHWGNNTVGILDISSSEPTDWHYINKYVVDYELQLNYSLTASVDRDSGSGYALRGTVFTEDNRYLLVGCMGAGGGIAVIDLQENKYLGRVLGMMGSVRHLVIKDGYLYLSINRGGYVQRIGLQDFIDALPLMKDKKVTVSGWTSCKVYPGARTICLSPDGRYVFASCNSRSRVCVVDTRTMTCILKIPADSYPVGMDLSDDGRYLITTSQAREGKGGNAVDIFRIDYLTNNE